VKIAIKAQYGANQGRSAEPQGDVEGVHSGVIYRKNDWTQGASRNHASTLIDPAAPPRWCLFFTNHYGNPFSGHWAKTKAMRAL
jgi:hypothetical protein